MTTYPITMTSGGVTAGLDELKAAFRALPDGDHIVTIAPAGDPAAAISEIVQWFGALDEVGRENPNLLGEMTEKARLLATYCYRLAEQAAAAKERAAAEESAVECQRKVLLHLEREKVERAGLKFNATAAGQKADYELLDAQKEADLSHRIASVLAEHLRASKEVLGVMRMNYLPMLRDERGQR